MARIALLFGSFRGGGVGRTRLRIARELLARGHQVDLIVGKRAGDLLSEVPAEVNVIELRRSPTWLTLAHILAADPAAARILTGLHLKGAPPSGKLRFLPSLATTLRAIRPDAVLSATAPFNCIAVWARTRCKLHFRIVASEHNRFSSETVGERRWRYDLPPELMRKTYEGADAVVAVSEGVRTEMVESFRLEKDRVETVYNPVVEPALHEKAEEDPQHPWLAPGQPPVVLGVGMLKPQKDFPTLIRAFALVRKEMPARLIILGDIRKPDAELAYRDTLHALPRELGIGADVDFPGFVPNPFAFMRRAGVFALSSAWEGLANVLIEALACGCPVVSTDCPSGPAEILDRGRFGRLVPVGDPEALAQAILATLNDRPDHAALTARSDAFSVEKAIDRYLQLLLGNPV